MLSIQKLLFLGAVLSVGVGCMENTATTLPIGNEKMAELLFDIHVAEAALSQYTSGQQKDSLANEYYDQIAEMHNVDRVDLDSSIAMLQRDPELTKVLYEKVVEKVEKARIQQ